MSFWIHARGDVDFFGHFDFADTLAGAASVAAVGFELHALNRQRAHSQRVSESGGDHFEVVHAFGVGLFVDAVERGDAFIFQIVRDALVRRQHEFFDEAMGDVALRAGDALHHSEFVELDDWFGEIEIDRSAAFAFAVQDHGEIAHAFEVLDLSCVFATRCGVAFDDGIHGGVSHAISGADHAFVDFVAGDLALVVNLHGAGEHEAVDLRAQAANVGREFERQHGHGAVGK